MSRKTANYVLLFSISVSIFGLILAFTFALDPPMANENFPWRRPLVGSIFSLICAFGAIVALSPKHCSETFHFRTKEVDSTSLNASIISKGHHPICKEFSAHVIHVENRTLCAACTGLFLGALAALVGTVFFFFTERSVHGIGLALVSVGIVGVSLGFFQLKFRSFARLILNVLFVFGAFLILVGIDAIVRSLFIDFFVIALIVFWIFTRIELSRWDHCRICGRCKSPCEVYEVKKGWS